MQDVADCKEMYAKNCPDYNDSVDELIRLLKPDHVPLSNEYEALDWYVEIINILEDV